MEHKKSFMKGALYGALVMLFIVIIGAGIFKLASDKGALDGVFGHLSSQNQMDRKLKNLRALIDQDYLYSDKINEKSLQDGAYAGYVSELGDPYTVYYNKKQTKELLESTAGKFSGIGAAITKNYKTGIVSIKGIEKDSPAEKAGLKAGDILYQVDGHVIGDQDLEEIVSWVKGKEGTDVTLQVYRGSDLQKVTLKVTRRNIVVHTVESKMMDNQIGYIKIKEFDQVTYKQFKTALDGLEKQGMKGIVMDLRSNPGGNLDSVVDILKLLLPKGLIVYTQDKYGSKQEYKNNEEHKFTEPMAVLVNENSASAAEIFTGAIQDYKIGKVVGVTTFGKGIVQQLIDLKDGTYLKVTIAEYFLPSGRSIEKKGIKPDIEVKYQPQGDGGQGDNQLDKALETIEGML